MKFEITPADHARINEWLRTKVYPAQIAEQKASGMFDGNIVAESFWADGCPYGGVIGGGTTYEFTPTSIGTVVKVKTGIYELDLTDYESW